MERPFATRRWAGSACFCAALLLTALPAARGLANAPAAPQSAPSTGGEASAGAAAEAVEVAWTALEALRDYVHASRLRDTESRKREFPEARRKLIELAHPGPAGAHFNAEVRASLWPAVIAHYVDGFERDRLRVVVTRKRPDAAPAVIATIAAVNPRDRELADELSRRIEARLAGEGLSGESLRQRAQVLLKRELAEQGVGYPIEAQIRLGLAMDAGAWKIIGVELVPPPAVAATQPAPAGSGQVKRAPGAPTGAAAD